MSTSLQVRIASSCQPQLPHSASRLTSCIALLHRYGHDVANWHRCERRSGHGPKARRTQVLPLVVHRGPHLEFPLGALPAILGQVAENRKAPEDPQAASHRSAAQVPPRIRQVLQPPGQLSRPRDGSAPLCLPVGELVQRVRRCERRSPLH
jgi:hypothetical protein